ncbi:Alpha/Beta hydrolase protein [Trichoderma barbatum]
MKPFTAPLILAAGIFTVSSFAQEIGNPVVILPGSEVRGTYFDGVESFFGIPYAESPAGLNRLKRPVRRTEPLGLFDATAPAPGCHQGHFSATVFDYPSTYDERLEDTSGGDSVFRSGTTSEDCLTITVQRPAGTKAGDDLPVLFMIQGYGFVMKPNPAYKTTNFLNSGIDNKQPFILVTANYRLGAWGFLPGKEVTANKTTNLGLRDQRMSMEWTSDNIKAFGGDPDRITLWGHGSGGVSVLSHLVINDGNATYNGRQLFHGVMLSSGGLMPAQSTDSKRAQRVYDEVVEAGGCHLKQDTLQCLREIPLGGFGVASSAIPGIWCVEALRNLYIPRPDGDLIRYSPEEHLRSGNFLQVPMIIGTQEDEGTRFTRTQPLFEDKTRKVLDSYLRKHWFPSFTELEMQSYLIPYSNRSWDNCPYRTNKHYELWKDQKRISAVLSDLFFTFPRRLAMDFIAASRPSVPLWGYVASHDYKEPVLRGGKLGTTHGSFEEAVFALKDRSPWEYVTRSIRAYMINFIYHQDPNIDDGRKQNIDWIQWKPNNTQLLWINRTSNGYIPDDLRIHVSQWQYNFMKDRLDRFRL